MIVNGTTPVWVHPRFDAERHMAHPPEPDDVRRALEQHPDAKGMLLITPTDWGTCADIRGVAAVCHEHDVPLIVDEAWGAHLPFHAGLPTWGMDADADLVVTSVHKMGAAIEQSSVFHLQGNRVDPTVLAQREDLLATTSASSLVYASLDGWRRHMVEQGEALLGRTLDLARRARAEIAAIDGIEVYGDELVREGHAHEVDPFVLTLDVRALGITGYQASEILRDHHHVDLGAADTWRVGARLTHADDDESVDLLVRTLRSLVDDARRAETPPRVDFPSTEGLELETVMLPREAFFAEVEQVSAQQAVGRVAAEMVTPYPPGVPVIAPGERITQDAVDYLRSGVAAGMLIPEAADPQVDTLRVVRDSGA
ncbi:aminotransferase class I/II-fold pyridoxal phosphate-dependent enzyme [Nocardioides zeicaulis]|uniref:Aminotransferase class I/II-fold pyridoxal phosphate-dependent enzyme n=1 Tax=Nocardioides zeicaulis TaxID=1776857 RepID=A0ABV6E483_9ACTN